VGAGVSGGYEQVDPPTPSQTYGQVNLRVTYDAGDKLQLTASGGVEVRQFDNTDQSDYISPVFNLGATYHIFDGTEIKVDGSRETFPSAVLAGQDYSSTTMTVGLRQRLLTRFFIGLTTGYENSKYFGAISGLSATRKDNYYFVQPSIDVALTRYWSWGIFYSRRQNNSADDTYSFENTQYGLRTLIKF
jgi:hypothetical protein